MINYDLLLLRKYLRTSNKLQAVYINQESDEFKFSLSLVMQVNIMKR